MPAGVTLLALLDQYKAEAKLSQNVAHGLNALDAQKYLLRRVQEELYTQHDWPNMLIDRDITINIGQKLYNYPVDIAFEYINDIWVKNASIWCPLRYGISPDDLNVYGADEGTFRTFPPLKWQHNADGAQLEIWPVPDQTSVMRIRGRKRLAPLIADTDVCTLDSTLIVLYAAAETRAEIRAEDAPLKLQKAQAHFNALRRRMGGNKRETIILGGGPGRAHQRPARVGLDFIPPGYGSGG